MEKEICVLCGRVTDVDVSTPIDRRLHYVECVGQLHPECWIKIYPRETKMMNVRPEKCETCRFFPDHCHYWNNEGANLSFLIADLDGNCSMRKPALSS